MMTALRSARRRLPARIVRAAAPVLAALAWAAGAAQGGVLLLPNLRPLPGELGYLMGGAQTALASGGEALWFNPAGLAHETGTRVTVSGDAARVQEVSLGGGGTSEWDARFGSLAFAERLGQRRGYPRFAFGFALAQHTSQYLPGRIAATDEGTAATLPPGLGAPGGLDAAFPDGITVTRSGESLGELRILAPGVGLGVAPADWVRLGIAVQIERVSLRQSLTQTSVFEASANGGANSLQGQSQLAWVLSGESLRMAGSLGAQFDLSRGLVLGLVLVLPSRTLDGSGRIHYQRADTLTVDLGAPGTPINEQFLADADGLPFRLDSPRRIQVGLAFRSDRFLIEFDLYRLDAQSAYEVLPEAETEPPSTAAFVVPAVTTSGQAVLGTALGLAYARTERTSVLLGIAIDPAPVPAADPLFRAVDVMTVTVGAYHVRGALSVSVGLLLTEARESAVSFAARDGGAATSAPVSVEQWAVRLGGSFAF